MRTVHNGENSVRKRIITISARFSGFRPVFTLEWEEQFHLVSPLFSAKTVIFLPVLRRVKAISPKRVRM